MAKKSKESTTEPPEETALSTAPPVASVSLEQKIANRLGYGISLVAEMLKQADRKSIAQSIDSLSNDELAERLTPSKKS